MAVAVAGAVAGAVAEAEAEVEVAGAVVGAEVEGEVEVEAEAEVEVEVAEVVERRGCSSLAGRGSEPPSRTNVGVRASNSSGDQTWPGRRC